MKRINYKDIVPNKVYIDRTYQGTVIKTLRMHVQTKENTVYWVDMLISKEYTLLSNTLWFFNEHSIIYEIEEINL